MRYLQYIQEDYVGSKTLKTERFKGGRFIPEKDAYLEVFVNPTPKEINTFTFLRFIADNKTKRFFIGNPLFVHDSLSEYLQKEKQMQSTLNCFMGAGEVKNGKIVFTDYSPEFSKSVGGPEFKWVTKYFTDESIQMILL